MLPASDRRGGLGAEEADLLPCLKLRAPTKGFVPLPTGNLEPAVRKRDFIFILFFLLFGSYQGF